MLNFMAIVYILSVKLRNYYLFIFSCRLPCVMCVYSVAHYLLLSLIFELCIMIVYPLNICIHDAGQEQCLVVQPQKYQKCTFNINDKGCYYHLGSCQPDMLDAPRWLLNNYAHHY